MKVQPLPYMNAVPLDAIPFPEQFGIDATLELLGRERTLARLDAALRSASAG